MDKGCLPVNILKFSCFIPMLVFHRDPELQTRPLLKKKKLFSNPGCRSKEAVTA